MKKTITILAVLAFICVPVASAATVTIANGDFEAQFGTAPFFGSPDTYTSNVVTDWTGDTSGAYKHGAVDPNTTSQQPTSGDLAAYMVGVSFLQQTLTHTITTGDTITLTLDGWINNGAGTMTVNFASLGAKTVNLGAAANVATNNVIEWTATSDISSGVLRFESAVAGTQVRLDTLSMEVVPEPATMSLLALGGVAMLRRRKK